MSDKPVSLTVRDLDDHLRDLVKWKRFALYLPEIDQSDIEVIVTEKHDDVAEQKLLLFSKWLSVHPKATWQDVTQALEKTDEFTIANKLRIELLPPAISSPVSPQQTIDNTTKEEVEVTEDIVEELDRLNTSFVTLTLESEKAIENGECSLSEVVTYVKRNRAYKICGLTEVRNVAEFFDVIEPHYTFLNCYLLVNLALSLLPSLKQSAQEYKSKVEEFKKGTKVKSLHKILTHFFDKAKFKNNVEVTIKVQNVWGECKMWLVEVLVQTLFRLNSPDECKWFRVLPGSLCVMFIVHEDMLITLVNAYKQNMQFMELMGVISLDTRNSFLSVSEDNVEYTFEQSLIEATKAGNTEAVKFLVKQLHVDINTRSNEEPTASLKEEADKWHEDENGNIYFKHDAGSTALMIACCNNDTDIVKLLLENDADSNIQSNLGFTALIYASCIGGIDCVRMLLDHNADVNLKKYSSGSSALFFASNTGNVKLVKILLKQKDINSNIQRNDGTTPLLIASQNGHLEIVERLLKENSNSNIPHVTGVTPLYIASQNGHLEIVKRLLKENAIPNTPCDDGATPLYIASQNGHLEIVERLLMEDANPNISLKTCVTPLHIASQNDHLEIVDRLLKEKVNPNTPCDDGATPLFIASQNGHLKIVERLLKEKVNPNTPCDDGATPLFIASQNGHLKIVDRLLKEKVNPNTPCDDGATPLFIASQNGHLEIVDRLFKENVNPNTSYDDGATPLFIASQNGHLKIVERLIKEKVDASTPRNDGATPLFMASQNGHLVIVKKLLKEKVNPNTPYDDGATPLFIASQNGHPEIVEKLLKENANPSTPRNDGVTPLFIASQNGHLVIVKKLLKEKVNPNTPRNDGTTPLEIARQSGHRKIVEILQEIANLNTLHKRLVPRLSTTPKGKRSIQAIHGKILYEES